MPDLIPDKDGIFDRHPEIAEVIRDTEKSLRKCGDLSLRFYKRKYIRNAG